MIRIGFIGLGGMGRAQVDAFAKTGACEIAAGSDPSADARSAFVAAYPAAKAFASHNELLEDSSIDAVVVATPTTSHCQITVDSLRAGRAVLVEKPMARTVEHCRQMIEAASETNKLLMVAHCRRFDPNWGELARLFRAGELGDRVLWRHVAAGSPPRIPWFMDDAIGGGPIFDGAIHNIDFANMLFGKALSVAGSQLKFDSTCTAVDTANAIIRYESGSQLLLSWSWCVPGQSINDVLGERATFVFARPAHRLLARDGTERVIPFGPDDMYVNQAKHFLDCVAGRATCLSPGAEAIKAVAVADAALMACRSGEVQLISPP